MSRRAIRTEMSNAELRSPNSGIGDRKSEMGRTSPFHRCRAGRMVMCAAGVVLLCLSATGSEPGGSGRAMEFGIDWAAFRGAGDSIRVEFFYAIPYGELDPLARDSGYVVEFSVRFQMEGEGGFSEDATICKQARAGSLVEAREARRAFVDGFSVSVLPGRYWFRIAVAKPAPVQWDTTGEQVDFVEAGAVEDSIVVPGFSDEPAMSSLQLAAGFAVDTVSGTVSVIPNPMRTYGGGGLDRIYYYFEGYNLAVDGDSYEVRTVVLNTTAEPETVLQTVTVRPKTGTDVSSALGTMVAGLAPGRYSLGVELLDRAGGGVASREVGFRVPDTSEVGGSSPYRLEMGRLERQHYEALEYIATKRELGYYNSLSDSGKQAYLAWFWARHDLSEFARRMETAARYRTSRTPGLKTDRGRIYVKYGEPDEVERCVIEIDRRPREYWHYYGQSYVFVFIDLHGDNDYRLAYTTSSDEPATGYERYLTPDEEELFR